MRVLVTGDRDWVNWRFINETLDHFHGITPIHLLIEGEARGADRFARNWAQAHKIPFLAFPAEWNRYGHAAGPIRNQQMIDEGHPDFAIAFHNDLENSKGTKDMVSRLVKHKIRFVVMKEIKQ